jgi:LacI family transcriptional regulator
MLNAVFQGLDQACAENGFHYLIEFGERKNGKPRMILENKVDGLLVKGSVTPWLREAYQKIPMVGLNQNMPGLPFDQFNCDDYHSGYLATEHLWARGHRRIAFLSNISHHPMLLMRFQGYERFMRSQRIYDPVLVHLPDTRQTDLSAPETDYAKFDQVLSGWWSLTPAQRPTAVVAANDWNAAGLYQTAARLGIDIPNELSLLAFDNTAELCDLLKPGLASFQVPLEKVTYLAAMRLIQKIDEGVNDETPVVQSVAGELVERESVMTIDPGGVGAVSGYR